MRLNVEQIANYGISLSLSLSPFIPQIPAELISLNPNQINKVNRGSQGGVTTTNSKDGDEEGDSEEEEEEERAEAKKLKLKKRKKRTRGKSTLTKCLQSQQKNRDEKTRVSKQEKKIYHYWQVSRTNSKSSAVAEN